MCVNKLFPSEFCGLGCRRAKDIALPSFLASMNSVGELVETILFRINILWTLTNLQRLWSLEARIIVVIPCPMANPNP